MTGRATSNRVRTQTCERCGASYRNHHHQRYCRNRNCQSARWRATHRKGKPMIGGWQANA